MKKLVLLSLLLAPSAHATCLYQLEFAGYRAVVNYDQGTTNCSYDRSRSIRTTWVYGCSGGATLEVSEKGQKGYFTDDHGQSQSCRIEK